MQRKILMRRLYVSFATVFLLPLYLLAHVIFWPTAVINEGVFSFMEWYENLDVEPIP